MPNSNQQLQYTRRIKRLHRGQTVHCPDCGYGFLVSDSGTADALTALYGENKLMRDALEELEQMDSFDMPIVIEQTLQQLRPKRTT